MRDGPDAGFAADDVRRPNATLRDLRKPMGNGLLLGIGHLLKEGGWTSIIGQPVRRDRARLQASGQSRPSSPSASGTSAGKGACREGRRTDGGRPGRLANPTITGGTESGPVRSDSWLTHRSARMVVGRATTQVLPVSPPPRFDPAEHRVHDRVSRPPEPSNWRRHGPYLRTLAVALVLTAAAASAGMLMALMGD